MFGNGGSGRGQVPRGVVLGAVHGRSGKTTVAMGICRAISRRGLKVQPFKKGPDFIDPGWLSLAAGRACRNLDLFMCGAEEVRASFGRAAADVDLALIEGAMGLFDGVDLEGSGSTARLAHLLRLPVVLLVDVTRMTRTAAAVVGGIVNFEAGLKVTGVILNRVGSGRQETLVRQAVEAYTGVPVIGALPRRDPLHIPERHLGLIPVGERVESGEPVAWRAVEAAAAAVEAGVDLDRFLALAAPCADLSAIAPAAGAAGLAVRASGSGGARLPVGVIRDRAFSFYYPENLEALEAAGAQLVILNALEDVGLATVDAPGEGENPPVAAIYAGGGFPEVMAAELEANDSFRADLRRAVARGLPVYAECGGLLYLVRQVRWGNRSFAMAGVLPLELEMRERPQGHGYVEAEVVGENPYFVPGQVIRGHEFHHSAPVLGGEGHIPGGEFVFRLKRGTGFGQGRDGLRWGSVFAAYTHIHVLGCPGWASALVAQARAYACERGERNTTWE